MRGRVRKGTSRRRLSRDSSVAASIDPPVGWAPFRRSLPAASFLPFSVSGEAIFSGAWLHGKKESDRRLARRIRLAAQRVRGVVSPAVEWAGFGNDRVRAEELAQDHDAVREIHAVRVVRAGAVEARGLPGGLHGAPFHARKPRP